ncbi:hypothetical protein BASA83_010701 [Batrachochytrium salamandrivorans]|nr:hypothetical protein BASA83_010701 [Batrachochytrium salamandrivorans]
MPEYNGKSSDGISGQKYHGNLSGTLGKPQIISEWKNGANYGYSISRPEMQFQDNPGHASASRFNLKPPSILARNFIYEVLV